MVMSAASAGTAASAEAMAGAVEGDKLSVPLSFHGEGYFFVHQIPLDNHARLSV